jgi:hypothetical protein
MRGCAGRRRNLNNNAVAKCAALHNPASNGTNFRHKKVEMF